MVRREQLSSSASESASQRPFPMMRCNKRSNRASRSHWRTRRSVSVLFRFALAIRPAHRSSRFQSERSVADGCVTSGSSCNYDGFWQSLTGGPVILLCPTCGTVCLPVQVCSVISGWIGAGVIPDKGPLRVTSGGEWPVFVGLQIRLTAE